MRAAQDPFIRGDARHYRWHLDPLPGSSVPVEEGVTAGRLAAETLCATASASSTASAGSGPGSQSNAAAAATPPATTSSTGSGKLVQLGLGFLRRSGSSPGSAAASDAGPGSTGAGAGAGVVVGRPKASTQAGPAPVRLTSAEVQQQIELVARGVLGRGEARGSASTHNGAHPCHGRVTHRAPCGGCLLACAQAPRRWCSSAGGPSGLARAGCWQPRCCPTLGARRPARRRRASS